MSSEKKGFGAYLILFSIVSIIGAVIGLFIANLVFVQWQKIPMEYYSYHLIYDYYKQYQNNPEVLKVIKICAAAGGFVVLLFNAIIAMAIFAKPKRELHGSAKFADMMDVRKTGFILTPKEQQEKFKKTPSNPSILVGKYKGKLLEFFGNEFTFVAAPTRSGKGVGIVIPNLLHYRDSVVVLDVKNENWDLTAGFRSKYQEVFLFAPKAEDGRSHRYNPLDYIDRNPTKRMGDIQNIANIMYPADGNDSFWQAQAQRLFSGLILYMLETPDRPCSMAELVKLSTPNKPLDEWITETINTRKNDNKPLSVECIEALMSFAGNSSENTRAGILSSLTAPLNIFTDPMVAAATSASDFRLDEVRKKRMSIYVGIQPNELPRFDKLLNLFFSQLINLNTRVLPEQDPSLKYQCLVLLDEFTALGRVDIINKAVAYIAGYNMRLMLIFQNKQQAEQFYTKEGAATLLTNMACQIIFAPRTVEDAESYSKLLGTQTVKGQSISKNRGKGGGGSISTSDQSRALMLPQEMLELDKANQIIKYDAFKPILCEKIVFYNEPVFQNRLSQERDSTGRQKGLPVDEKYRPPQLDIDHMLDVMRGTKFNQVQSIEELPSSQVLMNEHSSYIQKISDALGFDADFFNVSVDDEDTDEIILQF